MEMKDGLEMEGPFLAIGRQSKGLGFEDFECETSSSHWPVTDCSANNVCAKKSRIDDGEFWHRDDNPDGGVCGEFSQAQSLAGFRRAQQENCTEIIQGHWNAISCSSNNLNKPGSGLSMKSRESELNLGQSSRSGLYGYCEQTEACPNATSFDFLRTGSDIAGNSSSSSFLSGWVAGNSSNEVSFPAGSGLMEDKAGSWSGLVGLHAPAVGVPDTSSSLSCFADVSGLEGKNGRDLIVNLVQTPGNMPEKLITIDHQNAGMQAPLNRDIGDNTGSAEPENMFLRAGVGGDGICLDPSMCSYSLPSPEADNGKALFQIGNSASSSVDHSDNKTSCHGTGGRRSSCKRKISTPGIGDASYFQASEFSTRRESNTTRTSGVSGSNRPNPSISCTAIPDILLSTTNSSSMMQMQDDRHSGSSGFVGNENDLYEALRGSATKTSSLGGTSGSIQRTVRNRPVSSQQEHSHSLFARTLRRSMPGAQSQALFSRSTSVELSGDVSVNSASNMGVQGSDHWAPAFGQGSSISAALPGWGGTNSLPSSNFMLASFVAPVRERISGTFDGRRMRSMSNRSSSWGGAATMESRSTNLTSASRGGSGSMPRAMNSQEAIAQNGQVPNSILDSSSRISALLSNGRNSGGTGRRRVPPIPPPPMATHNPAPFGSSLDVIPSSAGMYAGPSSSTFRPPLFMDAQGGVLAAPVHSILGMPLRGLHILTADRENRQRFVSEILSALEHARRNEDLTFEELVLLDPSLIYGGIDIHDQHSDMRLDVDNMSYEELLALEERIGNVSTGLTDETISKCLRESKYSSLDATVAVISQETDIKCSICQEEYVEDDELGRLDCGHGYHTACIKQWLLQKNQCPVCKSAAYSNS